MEVATANFDRVKRTQSLVTDSSNKLTNSTMTQAYQEFLYQLENHEHASKAASRSFMKEIRNLKTDIKNCALEASKHQADIVQLRDRIRLSTSIKQRSRVRRRRFTQLSQTVSDALEKSVSGSLQRSESLLVAHRIQQKQQELQGISSRKAALVPVIESAKRSVRQTHGMLLEKELVDRTESLCSEIQTIGLKVSKLRKAKEDLMDEEQRNKVDLQVAIQESSSCNDIECALRKNVDLVTNNINLLAEESPTAVRVASLDWKSACIHEEYKRKVQVLLEKVTQAESMYRDLEAKVKWYDTMARNNEFQFRTAMSNLDLRRNALIQDHKQLNEFHSEDLQACNKGTQLCSNNSELEICRKEEEMVAVPRSMSELKQQLEDKNDSQNLNVEQARTNVQNKMAKLHASQLQVLEQLYFERCEDIEKLKVTCDSLDSSRNPSLKHENTLVSLQVCRRELHTRSCEREQLEQRIVLLQDAQLPILASNHQHASEEISGSQMGSTLSLVSHSLQSPIETDEEPVSKLLTSLLFQGDLVQLSKALQQELNDVENEKYKLQIAYQDQAEQESKQYLPIVEELNVHRMKLTEWYQELIELRKVERLRLSNHVQSVQRVLLNDAESYVSTMHNGRIKNQLHKGTIKNQLHKGTIKNQLTSEKYNALDQDMTGDSNSVDTKHTASCLDRSEVGNLVQLDQVSRRWSKLETCRQSAIYQFRILYETNKRLGEATTNSTASTNKLLRIKKTSEKGAETLENVERELLEIESVQFNHLVSLKGIMIQQVAKFFKEASIQLQSVEYEKNELEQLEKTEEALLIEIQTLEHQQQQQPKNLLHIPDFDGDIENNSTVDAEMDRIHTDQLLNDLKTCEDKLVETKVKQKQLENTLRVVVRQANTRTKRDLLQSVELERNLEQNTNNKTGGNVIPTMFPRLRCFAAYHPHEATSIVQIVRFLQQPLNCLKIRSSRAKTHRGTEIEFKGTVRLSVDLSRIEIRRGNGSVKDFVKLIHMDQVDERWTATSKDSNSNLPIHSPQELSPQQLRILEERSTDSAASSQSSEQLSELSCVSSQFESSSSPGDWGDDENEESKQCDLHESKQSHTPTRLQLRKHSNVQNNRLGSRLQTPTVRSVQIQIDSDSSESSQHVPRGRGRARSSVEESCVKASQASLPKQNNTSCVTEVPFLRVRARGGRMYSWCVDTRLENEARLAIHKCWVRGLMLLAYHAQDKRTGVESLRASLGVAIYLQ